MACSDGDALHANELTQGCTLGWYASPRWGCGGNRAGLHEAMGFQRSGWAPRKYEFVKMWTGSECPNGARHTSPGCNPGYGCVEGLRSVGTPHKGGTGSSCALGATPPIGRMMIDGTISVGSALGCSPPNSSATENLQNSKDWHLLCK